MQPLKDAGVPVLFRPYHEMNKRSGRFWWANRDPALYKQLWSIIFNYMTKTRGFNNLIWVWSPYAWDGTYGGDPWNYYHTYAYEKILTGGQLPPNGTANYNWLSVH